MAQVVEEGRLQGLAPILPRAIVGKILDVETNFWDIKVQKQIVYRYTVAVTVHFNGDDERTNTIIVSQSKQLYKHKICWGALQTKIRDHISEETSLVYNCGTELYTNDPLPLVENNLSFDVLYAELPPETKEAIKWTPENIRFIRVKICRNEQDSFQLADYTNDCHPGASGSEATKFLNILLNQEPLRQQYLIIGSGKVFSHEPDYDNTRSAQSRRDGADKGIKFVEAQPQANKGKAGAPTLLLDSRSGYFFVHQPLLQTLQTVYGRDFDMTNNGHEKWLEATRYVRSLKLFNTCANKETVGHGFSEEIVARLTIRRNNQVVSMVQYYQDTYNIRINASRYAIVVQCRGSEDDPARQKPFPVEVLKVAKNQRVTGDRRIQPPKPVDADVRHATIDDCKNWFGLNRDETLRFLRSFGVVMSKSSKRANAICRRKPTVIYQGGRRETFMKNNCSWKADDYSQYISSGRVGNIIFVYISNSVRNDMNGFATRLVELAKSYGVIITGMQMCPVRNFTELEGIMHDCKGKRNLVIFIDNENGPKRHATLKYYERIYLTPTMQIRKPIDEYGSKLTMSNIVNKINLKTGGLNYNVIPEAIATRKWISNGETLIISYDVCHPGRINPNGDITRPSVVGFSYNGIEQEEGFVGDFHFQKPNEEKVEDTILEKRAEWMISKFYTARKNTLPKNVLVIRDGVSEGQYKAVMKDELNAIKRGIATFAKKITKTNYKPAYGLVVATKRHSARFFGRDKDGICNIDPLTTIDRDVTRSNINEVFISSALASIGTSKPVAYQLLINEMGFVNMDEFEAFMIALTFHHQICEKSVSLPEPVFQSHEWAKRGMTIWRVCEDNETVDYLPGPHGVGRVANFDSMNTRFCYWNTILDKLRVNA